MTQDDDFMPTGCKLGRMNCRVISFSAAVGEERFLQATRRYLMKFLGEI